MGMKTVLLSDQGMSYGQAEQLFEEAAVWAKSHCQSFVEHTVADVSDFSYVHDQLAQYVFTDERDVMMFKLRYPHC